MRILIVSYYAESHLPSSAAQNTRLLATALVGKGHEVKVVCAAAAAGQEWVDGYLMSKLPLSSRSWSPKWLGAWRSDRRIRDVARHDLTAWRPDVLLVGAWKHLTEFALEAHEQEIPVVQIVHDYSLICLRQWLLDSAGSLCTGPTSDDKCLDCVSRSIGIRASLRSRVLSLPLLPSLATALRGPAYVANHHVPSAVGDALTHMAAYRQAVTLYVAQAPSVVELLGTAGIVPTRCRLLPQFIGDEKLERYPRPADPPGTGRPLRFAFVGRWSHEKGPDILLDAFTTADVWVDMELWIVSRNADSTTLKSVAEAGGQCSKRIQVIHDAQGSEVSRLLAQCDLCVVPSRCHELASRVVIEANAQGVPVIASSSVGNSYLIRDRLNGRVFPSGEAAALRGCIEEAAADLAVIRDWSLKVAEPIRRGEWTELVIEILMDALCNDFAEPSDHRHGIGST